MPTVRNMKNKDLTMGQKLYRNAAVPLSCLRQLQLSWNISRICRPDIAGCHSQLLETQCYWDSAREPDQDSLVSSAAISVR